MSTGLRKASLAVLVAALSAACATTRAAAPREVPALDVPMPPPRVIVPLPPEPLPVEPVADLPGSSTPAPVRPRPQRPAETPSKPDPTKTDDKPETPANAVAPPVPQLRMPDSGNSTQVSAQIRDLITRTRATLDNIDYRTLTQPRQKAYDDAKLFLTQAEEALKTSNLVVAKELADKAERLARELQGR